MEKCGEHGEISFRKIPFKYGEVWCLKFKLQFLHNIITAATN